MICGSVVEIEQYSVAYFDHIAVFEASSTELPLRAELIHAVVSIDEFTQRV